MLMVPLVPGGVLLGMVLTCALAVVLLAFGGGYWYLVKRNHQADDTTSHYPADDET